MDARDVVARFGSCASQPVSDWEGDIPLPEAIARFYEEVGPRGERRRRGYGGISVPGHGNDLRLVPLADLWKEQAGYRWDGRTKAPIGDWPPAWIVFAWEGADAYTYDAETQSVLFVLPGDGIDDAHRISGTPSEVVGALALFAWRHAEAGDTAMTEDFDLRPEWVESVRAELTEEFGPAGEDVITIATEI